MNSKTKNIIVVISFLLVIVGGLVFNVFTKDKTVSLTERRKLKQFPEITVSKLLDGKLSTEIEEYAMDQFTGRDMFRTIKAFTHFKILRQKDNNGYFIQNGSIYKQTGSLKESEVTKAVKKFQNIQNRYLTNNKVYFSIVPDKNYYVEKNDLKMDYTKLQEIMKQNLPDMQYINLFPVLSEQDYYKTDTHWKQENLGKIAKLIASTMNANISLQEVTMQNKGKFYGVYAGQVGLETGSYDELKYIVTPATQSSSTYNVETNKITTIYDEEKWRTSSDKYDFFLSGATPIITITNPNMTQEKELIIFRDSFASSLIPLLLEGYSKITLVDIRYVSSEYLDQYIEFTNQDVLFLYSTLVLNVASILK